MKENALFIRGPGHRFWFRDVVIMPEYREPVEPDPMKFSEKWPDINTLHLEVDRFLLQTYCCDNKMRHAYLHEALTVDYYENQILEILFPGHEPRRNYVPRKAKR